MWYDPRARKSVWVRHADGRVLEVPVVAGPALEGHVAAAKIDDATQAELNQSVDKHFEVSDDIVNNAARATAGARAQARKRNPPVAGKDPVPIPEKPPVRSKPDLKLVHTSPLTAEDWT